VRVIDLGSSTGTLLNDRRVEKNAVLSHGDRLAFGPFTVEVGVASKLTRAVRPAMQIDPAEVEREDGSAVTEVIAVYGRTVLDVQHVGQVTSKRASAPIFLALGGLLVLGGGAFFVSELGETKWSEYDVARRDAAEAGRPVPAPPGTGWGGLGMALAFLGLVPFGVGVIRLQDRGVPHYTIGEGHQAQFTAPGQGLPDEAAFPLVRGGSLHFTQHMHGDVTLEGQTSSLGDLVSSGRAAATGSTYSLPIPVGARCRVQHGPLTFHVNQVAPGRVVARKSEVDKPFWLFSAASAVVLGSLLVLAHLAMPYATSMSLDDQLAENRFVGYVSQPDESPKEEEQPIERQSVENAGGEAGERHVGKEGEMGNPTAKRERGLYAMKGPKDAIPQMARQFDPDMNARNAGILGMIQSDSGHFLASPFGGAFAVGNDDEDVWSSLTGTETAEAHGVGGLGLIGTGRGSGGMGEGTVGFGNVGLMGKNVGRGTRSSYGRGPGTGFDDRTRRVVRVRQGKAIVKGALDKDLIRRIVRAHINEVRHCYNQGLVRDPNLTGRVAVQFTIGPTGSVPASIVAQSSLDDTTVSNCVAKAVKRWKFPKPEGGGNVVVTYPFVLAPG
jgi:TonB family protein